MDTRGRNVVKPVYLYRFYSKKGPLLYVGITDNFERRYQQHKATARWWDEQGHHEKKVYVNRKWAEQAEREAIRTEQPVFNIRHNPRDGGGARKVNPLSGAWFLGDAERSWQGCILGEVAHEKYRVRIFRWMSGTAHSDRLVDLKDMKSWMFFDTNTEMWEAWDAMGGWDGWKAHVGVTK